MMMSTNTTRASHHWDVTETLLVHHRSAASVPEHLDPRLPTLGGHTTEVLHHGYGHAASVIALLKEDATPQDVADEIQRLHAASQPAAEEYTPPVVVGHTPNGREIRLVNGQYEVQPHNDNYWIKCDTLKDAQAAYYSPQDYR